MEKTKYRYKCMTCGTEEITSGEMLSCCACGSDELAKFELTSFIDVAEKKPAKKPRTKKPRTKKEDISLIDTDSPISILDPLPPFPPPPLPRPRPSIIIPTPSSSTSSSPESTSIWKKIYGLIKRPVMSIFGHINWKIAWRIAMPLAIGAAVYGIISMFI